MQSLGSRVWGMGFRNEPRVPCWPLPPYHCTEIFMSKSMLERFMTKSVQSEIHSKVNSDREIHAKVNFDGTVDSEMSQETRQKTATGAIARRNKLSSVLVYQCTW